MIRLICAGLCTLAMAGCGDSGTESATIGTAKVSNVDLDSFAQIKGIPERAEERREQAFEQFRVRSAVANYLVEQGFPGDIAARLEAQEAVNQIILQHYLSSRLEQEVTPEKIAEYYERHTEQFADRAYDAAHIFFRVLPNAEQSVVEAVKKKADMAYNRLVQGADFSVLARELSEDQATNEKGGVLPTLHSGNVNATVEELLSNMQPGELSPPIRTERGFQIFKLNAIEADPLPLEEVSDRIRHTLEQDVERKEMEQLKALSASVTKT